MELKNNTERANYALLALRVNLVLEIFYVFLLMLIYYENKNGMDQIDDILTLIQSLSRLIFIAIYFFSTITCAIIFIRWFRRAYYNLRKVGHNLNYSETWTIWGWIVPFVNLYYPYAIMKEIWDKTQESTIGKKEMIGSNLVGWWWITWLIATILERVSFRMSLEPNISGGQEGNLMLLDIVSVAFYIICNYLVLNIIQSVSRFEEEFRISREENEIADPNLY